MGSFLKFKMKRKWDFFNARGAEGYIENAPEKIDGAKGFNDRECNFINILPTEICNSEECPGEFSWENLKHPILFLKSVFCRRKVEKWINENVKN